MAASCRQPGCVPCWSSAPSSKTPWLLAEFSPGVGGGEGAEVPVFSLAVSEGLLLPPAAQAHACFFRPVGKRPFLRLSHLLVSLAYPSDELKIKLIWDPLYLRKSFTLSCSDG